MPVFVTVNVYGIVLPAVAPVGAPATLSIVSLGSGASGVVVVSGGLVTGGWPPGGVPVAVALLFDVP
ncbi:hypothetical protein, partial [Lysobacter sp. Root916]|uniref:hypothetical protein n=1 Tax=Lysobacter sp. Root916 TaxID=1736606 RepID=UPI001F3FA360